MTNPKITTVQQYTPKQALVTKSQSNNYLWNASHTKKIANLKNYSKTTFYASRLVSMRFPHYQYSVNYYYVTSNNSKLKGYVWAKTMVQGKYIKGGYYSYPKFNVLLTTKRITKQSEFSDSSQYSLGGYSTRTSLQNFTKIPSTSSMIKVINYYRQHDSDKRLPATLQNGAKQGVKIATVQSWTTNPNGPVRIPVIEFPLGKSVSWYPRATFAVAQDVMTANLNKVVSYGANNDSFSGAVYLNGLVFNFDDSSAQFRTAYSSTIKKVYKNNIGPHHDLSLVQFSGRTKYVLTSSIMYINPLKPVLKDGIWYGSGNAISGTQQGRTILSKLDPSKSKLYRVIGSGGFTQYQYQSGKWKQQFSINFHQHNADEPASTTDKKNVDVILSTGQKRLQSSVPQLMSGLTYINHLPIIKI
ncbi:hypothetical protein [Lentilactobacillus kosonis]|uniref:D-alanyl-D-alanine carboxypeptidase n=1 Tax=Lentilactobacillus kosonis TaxID=2810561 RepID=A0A401FN21_9LACO|nr:hypothetical protein [Lentilactobacillus kosonis]GAY73706.1 D-alanyl-D-alanine carboxypeptidase [Lentilactobacillus kosonis]